MAKKRSVARDLVEGLEEFVQALKSGADLSERFKSRTVVLNLNWGPLTPEDVKATRQELQVSQSLFAKFLGVSANTVRGWEHGRVQPSNMACRFLDEIHRNPEYWRERIRESLAVRVNSRNGGPSRSSPRASVKTKSSHKSASKRI